MLPNPKDIARLGWRDNLSPQAAGNAGGFASFVSIALAQLILARVDVDMILQAEPDIT